MTKNIFIPIVIIIAAILIFVAVASKNTEPVPTPTVTTTPTPTVTITPTPTPTPTPDVTVTTPKANSQISSPLAVTGKAPGTWFFEANLRLIARDANGLTLGSNGAQAQGEWMTSGPVAFKGIVTFTKPTTPTGTLVIMNDNPSGLPQNDKSFSVPIRFILPTQTKTATTTAAACIRTGCSGQICSDKNVISTCEWTEKYACYQTATCERQSNGSCGWTQTSALQNCLATAR